MVDLVCIFAALFFMAANTLDIVATVMRGKHNTSNAEAMQDLDPDYLSEKWLAGDETVNRLFLWAGLLKTTAWFIFMVPILNLAWILSRGGRRKLGTHAAISALTLAGSMAELISRLMLIGSYNTARWIANGFNLSDWTEDGDDNIGWRALEVAYIIVEGAILWIDAFEWFALFCIMSCLYSSIVTLPDDSRNLSLWLARLGLLIGILSLFDFSADVLRFESWSTFSKFAVLISILNGIFLLPVWLVMLSIQLPHAQPKYLPGAEEEAFVGNPVGSTNLHGHDIVS